MKKAIITFLVLMTAIVVKAQQIAVVDGNGRTNVYQTLPEAIKGATDGSTIYLPGGGFQMGNDSIKHRVTIIGVGHKPLSENVDGNTVISGELCFNEGSSGSAVMGCYISGDVNIGFDGGSVNNVIVKYCNLLAVDVQSNKCSGTVVNQNYIRNWCNFGGAEVELTNNIIHSIYNMVGGRILNNVITSINSFGSNTSSHAIRYSSNCTIQHNVFLNLNNNRTSDPTYGCNNNVYFENILKSGWGAECGNINFSNFDWNDVFENYNGGAITPSTKFHFKGIHSEYEDRIGIYGGSGFSDGALPPVPFIVAKSIPEQTDASGKLNIKIRVKAGE